MEIPISDVFDKDVLIDKLKKSGDLSSDIKIDADDIIKEIPDKENEKEDEIN